MCVCVCVCAHIFRIVTLEPLSTLCVSFSIYSCCFNFFFLNIFFIADNISTSMYIMCVTQRLFSALSRRAGALQMAIIIIRDGHLDFHTAPDLCNCHLRQRPCYRHVCFAAELRRCVKVEVAVPNKPYGYCGRRATLKQKMPSCTVVASTFTRRSCGCRLT